MATKRPPMEELRGLVRDPIAWVALSKRESLEVPDYELPLDPDPYESLASMPEVLTYRPPKPEKRDHRGGSPGEGIQSTGEPS